MRTIYFIIISIILLSCDRFSFKKNENFDIKIVKLNQMENQVNIDELLGLLTKIESKPPAAIVLKSLIHTPSDTLISFFKHTDLKIFGSCQVDPESGTRSFLEDKYFIQTRFLLKNTFREVLYPADTLLPYYKGLGVEAATFRNSGQLESYYAVIGINGKSFASLPLNLVINLYNKSISDIRPNQLYISKSGTLPVRFSDAGEVFKESSIDEIVSMDLSKVILIIYSDDEKVLTLNGNKSKAEITADMINQLLNQLEVK